MVSTEILASVDALSDAERVELLAYIEDSLGAGPSTDQQVTADRRLAEMKADPDLGLTLDEAVASARALTA